MTLRRALQELTRATAARLGAGRPALGDPGTVGPGGILLAAALGGRERAAEAARLAALIPAPALGPSATTGWLEALARHAVVGAAVTADDPVSRACLDASPLSNVLVHPAEGQSERAVDTAVGLLARPRGPGVLTAVLSAPATVPEVLSWRGRLLSRLARSHSPAVAGVYAAALLQHGTEWRHQLRSAALALETSVAGLLRRPMGGSHRRVLVGAERPPGHRAGPHRAARRRLRRRSGPWPDCTALTMRRPDDDAGSSPSSRTTPTGLQARAIMSPDDEPHLILGELLAGDPGVLSAEPLTEDHLNTHVKDLDITASLPDPDRGGYPVPGLGPGPAAGTGEDRRGSGDPHRNRSAGR